MHPKLCANHHFITVRLQHFPQQFFIDMGIFRRAVYLCRIKKGIAHIHGFGQKQEPCLSKKL